MAEMIPGLRERQVTDQKLSFGLYFVLLLVFVVLGMIIGSFSFWFGWSKVVSPIVSMAIGIYIWWYNWRLYKRRNEHFGRIKRLKAGLMNMLSEKLQADVTSLTSTDLHLAKREQVRSKGLFLAWLVFAYLGYLSPLHMAFSAFSLVGLVLSLIVLYYLTVDFHYHEQGEIAFLARVSEILKQKEISFDATVVDPLPRRRYGLYIFLSIITFGLFGLYWAYVVFRDPNHHFDTHEHWESQLERIVATDIS